MLRSLLAAVLLAPFLALAATPAEIAKRAAASVEPEKGETGKLLVPCLA